MRKLKRSCLAASALIALLAVTGCTKVEVSAADIEQATKFCSDHGGLKAVHKRLVLYPNYLCNDDVYFIITGDAITRRTPNGSDS